MLNLENLQSRRTRFDLIAMIFFEFRVSNTRGHSYKLYQQFSICTSRSNSEYVVTLWNSLPGDRVNFTILHKFKSSLKSIDLCLLFTDPYLFPACVIMFMAIFVFVCFNVLP